MAQRGWTLEEVERMVTWMEENPELLQGKQVTWHKELKQEVFPDEEHITVKKITDKATNMKRAWKEAKALQDSPGCELIAVDNERSIKELLEKKCTFFWRLNAIWGSRPAGTVIASMESIPSTRQSARQSAPQSASQLASKSALRAAPQLPARLAPRATPQPTSESIGKTSSQESISQSTVKSTPQIIFQSTSIPTRQAASQAAVQSSSQDPPQAALQPALSEEDMEFDGPPTPPRSTFGPRSRRSEKKRDLNSMLRQALDDRQAADGELALKRQKAEIDAQRERLAAEERIAQIHRDAQIKQAESIARIQADAQVKQAEIFARVMEKMVAVIEGAGGGAAGGAAGGTTEGSV
ncbi:hypothetical protein BGX38DRAFT_1156646 [Terfezia claveryi]|nr:hypothetical protein BGX38DRAFT_1156646 [Terfezia claveryi]